MNIDNINEIIKTKPSVSIYFSGVGCGVCEVLQPKIKKALDENFPLIEQYYFDIEEYKKLAISFDVFVMPTLLIFIDGKEFIRKSRNMSVDELITNLKRPYKLFFEN